MVMSNRLRGEEQSCQEDARSFHLSCFFGVVAKDGDDVAVREMSSPFPSSRDRLVDPAPAPAVAPPPIAVVSVVVVEASGNRENGCAASCCEYIAETEDGWGALLSASKQNLRELRSNEEEEEEEDGKEWY